MGRLLKSSTTGRLLKSSTTGHLLKAKDWPTRVVAHFRGGSGDTSGDWEFGLGASTSSISSTGQFAWSDVNGSWNEWSLDYSGAGGTLTLTLGGASITWTPGAAIPNDASNWRLQLKISVDPTVDALVQTQAVALTIGGNEFGFANLKVQSPAGDDADTIGPYQLGNQAWTISSEVGTEILMSWNGSIPTGSKMQVILSLQQED